MYTNTAFEEIERLHSEWSRMDNVTKLALLTREKIHLNQIANQMVQFLYAKGGFSNNEERATARKLLEMIHSVDAKGTKVMNDIRNDALKEIAKYLMNQ